jgi:murein tripeptide amidase MpaA
MAYLDVTGINACISYLGSAYPSMVQVITVPEPSREGTTIRAFRLGANSAGDRRAVLLIGGVHARELVNPDMLLSLSVKLCQSYSAGTGLTFGGKTFSASDVKLVLDTLDVFVLPLVNPDGRAYVQSPAGYAMWRKNRAVLPGTSCRGVDLNRNCDFLWQYAIGQTSTNPCSDTYNGTAVFSEPEERNVRWMLDTFERIHSFVDVHSYSELVLYPWGDDTTQTADSTQNFLNPAWNGQRGPSGGYAEYMLADDKSRFEKAATRVVNAIAAVRGHVYTAEPSAALYPTSGTNEDYAYSRHRVNSSLEKVWAFTFETGLEFQPAPAEADWVVKEGSAGVLELLLHSICAIDIVSTTVQLDQVRLSSLSQFRDTAMRRSRTGRQLVALLDDHGLELARLALRHPRLAKRMGKLVAGLAPTALDNQLITREQVAEVRALAGEISKLASPPLQKAIRATLPLAGRFTGNSARDGLRSADAALKSK